MKCNWKYLNFLHNYQDSDICRDFSGQMMPVNDGIAASLIVPLYNSSDYLPKLLPSLVEQKTKWKYEVILIDDGSTDDTLEAVTQWVKKYPDKLSIYTQKNSGISCARNLGIDMSVGIYIGFIDHDDCIDSLFIEKMLCKAFDEDADFVKCSYEEKKDGQIIDRKIGKDCVYDFRLSPDIMFSVIGYIWGGVFKRDIFEQLHFPKGYWYEDMIKGSLLLRKVNKYVEISDILYCKNVHDKNASQVIWSSKNNKSIEQLYLIKEIVKANDLLGLDKDVFFYRRILKECSSIMRIRIRNLNHITRYNIFLGAREILLSLWKEEWKQFLSDDELLWSDVILNGKFFKWLKL